MDTTQDVEICQADDGREPFSEWLDTLDPKAEAVVISRIDRVEEGNFGDHRSVGKGVSELRIDFGPGYRVYYGRSGNVVHLIMGGSKRTQDADIKAAIKFWSEHA